MLFGMIRAGITEGLFINTVKALDTLEQKVIPVGCNFSSTHPVGLRGEVVGDGDVVHFACEVNGTGLVADLGFKTTAAAFPYVSNRHSPRF
jgi:hypothetical protein